jgi:hypothetical protein
MEISTAALRFPTIVGPLKEPSVALSAFVPPERLRSVTSRLSVDGPFPATTRHPKVDRKFPVSGR